MKVLKRILLIIFAFSVAFLLGYFLYTGCRI